MHITNPFYYGNPAPTKQFVGREKEIRRILSRIINLGQSTAIIGEPRSGKTSLLAYICNSESCQNALQGDGIEYLFSFLDIHILGEDISQSKFWALALRPLEEKVMGGSVDDEIVDAYNICKENEFGSFVLERLYAKMQHSNIRLVLILDEFDGLLTHPVLNTAEFFGSLRALVSRSHGAVSMIIGSRKPLSVLNDITQQFNRTGSPYFNFLSEIVLGPLSTHERNTLLGWAGDTFTTDDHRFIQTVAGAHPFLLQATASMLWEIYEDDDCDTPVMRLKNTGDQLYDLAASTIKSTWDTWTPEMRMAVATIGLAQMPNLIADRKFYNAGLLRDIRSLDPEIRILSKQGFIIEDKTNLSGWQIQAGAFLWWLADELLRTVRDQQAFESWIRMQEWDGLLTKGEKDWLAETGRSLFEPIKQGANELIKLTVKNILL